MKSGASTTTRIRRAVALFALLLGIWLLSGCGGGNGGNLTSTGSGSGSVGAPTIYVDGYGDSVAAPASAIVVPPGTTQLALKVGSADGTFTQNATHTFSVTNSNPTVISGSLNGNTFTINATPGRAALHVTVPSLGIDRYVGVIVKNHDGSLPALPGFAYYPGKGMASKTASAVNNLSAASHMYLGVQSTAEDALWMAMSTGHMPDMRDRYLNNGFTGGWYSWIANGGVASNFINASYNYGMLPVFVYYQVPGGGGESAANDYANLQDATFMKNYFTDLYHALKVIKATGKPVAIILEPDFLGYMMQTYSGTNFATRPASIPAAGLTGAYQVYEEDANGVATTTPILKSGDVPDATGNNLKSFVLTVNHLCAKYAPNAQFGWEASHWASGAQSHTVQGGGIAHFTDAAMQTLATDPTNAAALTAFHTARTDLDTESNLIAQWYVDAGCTTGGATFMCCDKYGVDGADPDVAHGGDTAPNGTGYVDPPNSAYFWNAVQWNNYLRFLGNLHTKTNLPVLLWQLPTGHLNGSTATAAGGPNSGGWPGTASGVTFPDLLDVKVNTSTFTTSNGCWEESGPQYFLGDTFTAKADPAGHQTAAQRYAWFGQSDPDFPNDVTKNAGTLSITYAEHMTAAKAKGVIGIIFGPGVGQATQNVGWQDQWTNTTPTDSFWFMNKLVKYIGSPVALP